MSSPYTFNTLAASDPGGQYPSGTSAVLTYVAVLKYTTIKIKLGRICEEEAYFSLVGKLMIGKLSRYQKVQLEWLY